MSVGTHVVEPRRRSERGMTLVEVSIVVVMIGVLASLAIVGFLRYRRSVRMAEATSLVTSIRAQQEAYKVEQGLYLQASSSQTSYYPAPSPGPFRTQWGGPCTTCTSPDAWTKLNVHPSQPVMYGYATIAGVGEDIVTPHTSSSGSSSNFWGGSTTSGSTTNASPCAPIGPTDPFYIVQAQGDTDGDGVSSTVLAVSCSNALVITNEGE